MEGLVLKCSGAAAGCSWLMKCGGGGGAGADDEDEKKEGGEDSRAAAAAFPRSVAGQWWLCWPS